MINPRISAVWSTTKPIEPFSCTPRVQEVHTKAEVVHLSTGLLGLGVLFNRLYPIDAYKRETCAVGLREGLKLADSLFSEGKWRVVGGGRVCGP